ncbi:MAG: FAD-dependent oxidoreductase [Clostridia bacterium]|nr:FAD-dependent oxidoreductase [Clostridia bacterium]
MTIREEARELPLGGSYDVIVAGGGIAGISASLAAAREGKKVLLLERMFTLGGLATAGLVTIYLPLCDGRGHQVSFGIAEELLRLSVKLGVEPGYDKLPIKDGCAWLEPGHESERTSQRFEVEFSANVFAILAEQLLAENGVEILYGTTLTSTITEENKIKAVVIENKSGRQALLARSFVDATGDADLCKLAAQKTAVSGQGNVLASWYYEHDKENYRLNMLGFAETPDKYKKPDELAIKKRRYTGLDGREISAFMMNSHRSILNDFTRRGGVNGDHAVATIASIPQFRMTRRIDGKYTLDDTEMFKRFEDSIGMISDWRKVGPVYEVPFRTLVGDVKNLVTCGRIISVTDAMWDISRVIPPCAVTGEAAGLAAALSDDFGSFDVSILQDKLRENGVKLHVDEAL